MQQRKKKISGRKKIVLLCFSDPSANISFTFVNDRKIYFKREKSSNKERGGEGERKKEREKEGFFKEDRKDRKKKLSTNAFFNKDFGLNGCLFFTFVVIFVYQFDKIPDELVLCAMLGLFVTLPVGSLVCRRNTIFFFTPSNSLDYPLNYLVWLEEEGTKKKETHSKGFSRKSFQLSFSLKKNSRKIFFSSDSLDFRPIELDPLVKRGYSTNFIRRFLSRKNCSRSSVNFHDCSNFRREKF